MSPSGNGHVDVPARDYSSGFESRLFEIKVRIDPDLGGATAITNTASVTSDAGESDPADNTVSLTHLVNELADVGVTKLCKPDTGPAPAGTNGALLDLGDEPRPVDGAECGADRHARGERAVHDWSASPSQGVCAIAHPVVTCTLGDIDPGATAQMDVTVSSSEGVDVNDTARSRARRPTGMRATTRRPAGCRLQGRRI